VEDTQDLLNDFIGYADTADDRIVENGIFGSDTESAMRSFEATVGVEPDGIATLDDRELLEQTVTDLEVSSADSVVALGDESVFVGTWQSRLNIWNDLVLELPTSIRVNDRFGQDTEVATLAVEELLGLQVDGIVEPEDRAALRNAIRDVRSQQDVTILRRTEVDGRPVLVKALFVNNQYCLRFSVGYAADERCTNTPGGDLNTAFYVTINDVSFIAGTANPNVAFVQVATQGSGSIPLATRQIGDSLARAWVELVDDKPDTIELREVDGSSVLELRFSLKPTDRDSLGPTLSIISSQYAQSFFVDSCERPSEDVLSLEGSLAGASIIVTVTDGVGSARISSGTVSAPVEIGGTVTALDMSTESIVITGEFEGALFDGVAFTATTTCS